MNPCDLHKSSLIVDACAPILRNCDFADLWIEGGATCALATLALHDDTRASTLSSIGQLQKQIRQRNDLFLGRSVSDIRSAKANGKFVIVIMFQSSAALDGDTNMIDIYYQLGVRSINLAYNQTEAAADGCMEPRDGGLSRFGRQVIAEMNRVGMLLDLSHTGYRSTMEAMELSASPVVFTHSNAKAIYDHPRNLRDDQIIKCAAAGGVIGLNGHPAFVKANSAAPSIDDYLAHLDYMVEKAGIDHVGIGLDFSQPPGEQMSAERYQRMIKNEVWTAATLPPPPWSYPIRDARHLEVLTESLVKRGWSETDVHKVLGENFLRLFQEVWK